MEHVVSLPCSQKPATSYSPHPNSSSSRPPILLVGLPDSLRYYPPTSGLYPSLFSAKILHAFPQAFLSSTNVPHAPNISSSWYDQPNNNWWGIRITKILNMQFSPVSWHFHRLRPKYFPQQPISGVGVPSFLNMRDQVPHSWKKSTEKIIVLCILTFIFLGSKRNEEISWTAW